MAIRHPQNGQRMAVDVRSVVVCGESPITRINQDILALVQVGGSKLQNPAFSGPVLTQGYVENA